MGKGKDKQRRKERRKLRKREAFLAKPEPRSFHPDDAFNTVGADEAHRLGLITDEMHSLAKTDAGVKTKVSFVSLRSDD